MKNVFYFLTLSLWLVNNYVIVMAQSSCATLVKNFGKDDKYYVSNITRLNDKTLLFCGTDEFYGTELWKTDGTPEGTKLIKDIFPGLGSSVGLYVSNKEPFVYAGIMYFYARTPDFPNASFLWRSDGTAEGTYRLRAATGSTNPLNAEFTTFTVYKNSVYFWSNNTLYKTQGTIESTIPVLGPEFNFDYGRLGGFTEYKGELWFVDGVYFWHTNGTKEGTVRVNYKFERSPEALTVVNDKLYFSISSDLWQTDGTPSGMKLVREGVAGSNMFAVNNILCFIGDKGLWQSDGTLFGTFRILEAQLGGMFYYKNELYFIVSEPTSQQYFYQLQIWKTNGTKEGTVKVVTLDKTSIGTNVNSISHFFENNGKLYFFLGDYNFNASASLDEIWQTDGTQAGTRFICTLRKNESSLTTYLGDNSGGSDPSSVHLTLMDNYLFYLGIETFYNKYSNSIYRTSLTNCPSITATITGTPAFCPGGTTTLSVTATGGTGPYTYRWLQGTTAVGTSVASLTINTAGTYTVTATDANGCAGTAQVTAVQRTAPTVSLPATAAFCAGQSTVLTASATGGTSPYTYQWKQGTANAGSTAATLTVNVDGPYSVAVTDASGCASASASTTVTKRPSPTATVTASAPGFTTGGSVSLSANTGTGLTYQWTRDGQPITGAIQATYTAQQPGSYGVIVSLDGCSATAQAVAISLITALEDPQPGIDFQVSVSPNPSQDVVEVSMNGQPGRTVSVTLSIRDLTGRSLYQKQLRLTGHHTERLDLSQQPAGMYLLNAATDKQQINLRLIRE